LGKEGDGIGRPGCGTVEAVQAAERQMRKCQLPVLRRIVLALLVARGLEKRATSDIIPPEVAPSLANGL